MGVNFAKRVEVAERVERNTLRGSRTGSSGSSGRRRSCSGVAELLFYFFFSGLSAGQVQSIQAPRKPVQKTPPASGPSYTRLGADRAKNMPAPRPPAFAPSAQPNCPCRIVLATAPGSGPSGALGPRHPNCAGTSLPFSQHSDSPPPPNHHLRQQTLPFCPAPKLCEPSSQTPTLKRYTTSNDGKLPARLPKQDRHATPRQQTHKSP